MPRTAEPLDIDELLSTVPRRADDAIARARKEFRPWLTMITATCGAVAVAATVVVTLLIVVGVRQSDGRDADRRDACVAELQSAAIISVGRALAVPAENPEREELARQVIVDGRRLGRADELCG